MKISLVVTVLILAIGGAWLWQDFQRLEVLRNEHREIEAQARAVGVEVADDSPSDGSRTTRRLRKSGNEETRQRIAMIVLRIREMQEVEKKEGTMTGPEREKWEVETMEMISNLSPKQLKVLLSELKNTPELDDRTRQGVTGFAIMMLADSSPQAALSLLTESAEISEGLPRASHLIQNALSLWAKEDPLAALEWVRKNSEKHADVITDEAKQGIVEGAALQDPRLALRLLGELGLPPERAGLMMLSARTPEARTASLQALRDHSATMPEGEAKQQMEASVLSTLANTLREVGYKSSSAWLADAGLEPQEKVAFASGLHYHITQEESGQWVGWMAKELAPEQLDEKVRDVVSQWTREDFQSAGSWLAQAPDDAAKAPAVRAFAETVAAYEPETAEQWALTLPPGDDRQQTLRSIHQQWPRGDESTKAAFAERHAIR